VVDTGTFIEWRRSPVESQTVARSRMKDVGDIALLEELRAMPSPPAGSNSKLRVFYKAARRWTDFEKRLPDKCEAARPYRSRPTTLHRHSPLPQTLNPAVKVGVGL
jgi:hypothetical protein